MNALKAFFFILGAPDPEMNLIETMLRTLGLSYAYATHGSGNENSRVHAGVAYKTTGVVKPDGTKVNFLDIIQNKTHLHGGHPVEGVGLTTTALIECGIAGDDSPAPPDGIYRNKAGKPRIVIDHHRPGDPGYGLEPARYMEASSIGQLLLLLAKEGAMARYLPPEVREGIEALVHHDYAMMPSSYPEDPIYWWADPNVGGLQWIYSDDEWDGNVMGYWPRDEVRLAAAADHCLGAAYRGQCPGVDPDALEAWRIKTRAAFQGRDEVDVRRDVEAAKAALQEAPKFGGHPVADLRKVHLPELPEASARLGMGFISEVNTPDNRRKVVVQNAPEEFLRAFIAGEILPELTDRYGDPVRGFAGGYLPSD